MDDLQKYLNSEYQKEHDDTVFLTNEELAQMNPATELDIKMADYLSEYEKRETLHRLISEKNQEIINLQQDIADLEVLINDCGNNSMLKSEYRHDIMEDYVAIRLLKDELRSLEQKLSEGHGRSR